MATDIRRPRINRILIVLIILAGLSAISACKKTVVSETCSPEHEEYTWQPARQIDRKQVFTQDTIFEHYTYTVKDGNNIVFNYTLFFKDCPYIADDEGSRIVTFEVPANVTNFQLKDSVDFRNAKAMFAFMCLCGPGGPVGAKIGFLEGEKTGPDKWHLKGSLKITPARPAQIDFESDFIKK